MIMAVDITDCYDWLLILLTVMTMTFDMTDCCYDYGF
jgi:hypothetical protein